MGDGQVLTEEEGIYCNGFAHTWYLRRTKNIRYEL